MRIVEMPSTVSHANSWFGKRAFISCSERTSAAMSSPSSPSKIRVVFHLPKTPVKSLKSNPSIFSADQKVLCCMTNSPEMRPILSRITLMTPVSMCAVVFPWRTAVASSFSAEISNISFFFMKKV